mmetsp:Transcript_52588/g.97362  ORF Transcript_52588/g.97362 Transcript_52588/m.97362 type:complete len:308 (+) Transcript_52588:105-1028(+)
MAGLARAQRQAAPLQQATLPRRVGTLVCLFVCVALSVRIPLPSRFPALVQSASTTDSEAGARSEQGLPPGYAQAVSQAWREIDGLARLISRRGVVPDFGRRADSVVRKATSRASSKGPSKRLVQVLDAPLHSLFKKQLQTLRARLMDQYEADMFVQPNPLEAAWHAEKVFTETAQGLVRPGSDWEFAVEHEDLLAWLNECYKRDMELVAEQGKQGAGTQITTEVIRALQEQAASVQRTADAHGAFPWEINWQWIDMRSLLGFRGQYNKGRSFVELLYLPSGDPQKKKKYWWHRLGPANLAMSFDALI